MKKNYQIIAFLSCSLLFAQTKSKDSVKIDTLAVQSLEEVVVSASRIQESILKSPVTIENINRTEIENMPAPSFFDGLKNIKGVQMLTPSLGFKIINTRGFANTTNVRFTQMVDGFDNQAPHIGAPIGNALGPTDLDIDRVEIIPGTTSALYGLNAINGLANFITKDPFASTGISIQQKTGMNHLGDINSNVRLFNESVFRVAEKIGSRFAFKINFSYTSGYDWIADDRTDLNPNANAGVGIGAGPNNPAYDPVNGYGNESSNRRTLTLGGTRYVIARTGYSEKDVADYDIQNVKGDIGLYYKFSPKTTISYIYRFADLDNAYQRANRFTLKDYILQQHAVEIRNEIFQIRAFATSEDTGKSYNLRSAAENMDRQFKSDNDWYSDFTSAFNNAIAQPGMSVQQALASARSSADLGRLQPGSTEFQQALNQLADVNNWDEGAALRVKDWLIHGEGQVNISKAINPEFENNTGLQLLAGLDYQSYIIKPDGNYFINPTVVDPYSTLTYSKTGGFVQASKDLFGRLLKLSATLRVDKNDYFDVKYNPRFSAVLTPADGQSIRFSFQSGSRFPSIFEAFSNVNSGGVRRVGGLRVMSDGVFENGYLRSSIDRFQAVVTADFNNGSTLDDAIQKNRGILQKNTYTYLKPEKINSFEAGYKGLFFNHTLKVDADFYFNRYNNFIAQIEMNVPHTTVAESIPYYLNDRTLQDRYRIYTNSQSVVYNYGSSLGISYMLNSKYSISGNVSYAKLSRTDNGDGFEDGFNTPQWIGNISFSGENVWKALNFNVTYKRQSSFYWRSFLVNGDVKAYGALDAQVSYKIMQSKLDVKIGATNLTNTYYNSFLGGPAVGGLYYTTFTYQLQ